ncbi:shikimate dehydrogenase [Myceligenerans crystallogenes]|uniref:shikimate dehydrogenase n=1 Tax=Myceligenerans crystallogenes TaxID=316335 RepID=UPI0031D46778
MTAAEHTAGEPAGDQGTTTRRAAVLGHPIAHSLSPVLHTAAYRALGLTGWEYGRHDVDEDWLPGFLSGLDPTWAGLSLTMPLKHRIMDLVDHVDPLAAAVGAVNTVLVSPAGSGDTVTLTGTNTDVHGLVQALREGLASPGPFAGGPGHRAAAGTPSAERGRGKKITSAVVLGGGATAASALAALAELGCTSPRVLVRSLDRVGELTGAIARMGVTPEVVEFDLTGADPRLTYELTSADVVVSTLPPRAADPLAKGLLHDARLDEEDRPGVLLDVAYDPRPTKLAATWELMAGVAVSGERMLLHQAVEQVRLMTGYTGDLAPVVTAMDTALNQALDV